MRNEHFDIIHEYECLLLRILSCEESLMTEQHDFMVNEEGEVEIKFHIISARFKDRSDHVQAPIALPRSMFRQGNVWAL
jgi:hypothetical protein